MSVNRVHLDMPAVFRVLNQPPAVKALQRRAARVVAEARLAPRGAHGGSHEVDKITIGETRPTAHGAVVIIDWPSHVWHLIEFGSVNNPPYRPVTRAAQNNGLRVIDRRSAPS